MQLARWAAHFPDGRLYLDAAGTSEATREPAVLVADALVSLGIGARGMPDDVTARSSLLRSILADRRVLIVVDDAGSAAQVSAILPPNGRSAVLISSRRLLTELPGSTHLELGPLGAAESFQLLSRIVGAGRVTAEVETAHAITDACGHLPLSNRCMWALAAVNSNRWWQIGRAAAVVPSSIAWPVTGREPTAQ